MADEISIVVRAEDQFSSVLGNFGSIITGIESAVHLVSEVFQAGAEFVGQFVDSASESELAVAQLEAIIRATGGAAGLTSDQLQDMANQLQLVTRYSDETILGGASLMLTFRNIGDEMMTRAIPLMLDMAEVFGSVDSSAMQLGKALNDPVNMLGALSRAGVTFSEEQKETIKTMVEMGNLAGAQTLILNELEMQVGGTAEAMGRTFAGQIDIAKNKLDTMKETIGNALLPMLGDLLSSLMNFAETNPVIQGVLGFFERFTELQNSEGNFPLLSSLGAAMLTLEPISPILHDIGFALLVFQGALETGLSPMEAFKRALDDLATASEGSPFGRLLESIQEFIDTGESEGWGAAIGNLWDDIIAGLDFNQRIQTMMDGLSNQLIVWTQSGQAQGLVNTLGNFITDVIVNVFEGLDETIGQVDFAPFITALTSAIWAGVRTALSGIGNAFWGWFATEVFNDESVDSFWASVDIGFDRLVTLLSPATSISTLSGMFRDLGHNIINALWDGWNNALDAVGLGNVADWWEEHIVNPIKDLLGIHSRSQLFFDIGRNIVLGLIDGIGSMIGSLVDIITLMLGPIQPILDLLGIDLGTGSTTGSHNTGIGGTTGGRDMGTTGTGGLGQTVNNYFYGTVYFNQSAEDTNYDCPSPHPLLTASQGSLLTSGI